MVSVLFTEKKSVYDTIDGIEVYNKERNALTFDGRGPIVAHPPCRAWGRLRAFAKPEPGEKELAIWAVSQVRQHGGVVEHPESSALWAELDLPFGLDRDEYGGFTLSVDQFWWGHRARKRSWFYICGIEPSEIPAYPIRFDAITHTVSTTMRRKRDWFTPKPSISRKERSATPIALAEWLIELASNCKPQNSAS